MSHFVVPFIAAATLASSTLDGGTSVPLGAVLASAGTVFLVGMWVSAKVTKFESVCGHFFEQQQANMKRLDALDQRLVALDDHMRETYARVYERLAVLERRHQR